MESQFLAAVAIAHTIAEAEGMMMEQAASVAAAKSKWTSATIELTSFSLSRRRYWLFGYIRLWNLRLTRMRSSKYNGEDESEQEQSVDLRILRHFRQT